jgi:hypothetical protein
MVISTVEVDRAECDACGEIQYSPDSYAIYGVSGTVAVTSAADGFSVNFFSCEESAGHIGQAVVNAIARERER